MSEPILLLDFDEDGLIAVYSDHIEIIPGDAYYSGNLDKLDMIALRDVLNTITSKSEFPEELPETD